jgi:hypothetical protein
MRKLGSAASQRIAAVSRWLTSQVGSQGARLMVQQLSAFPVAGMVEMFETLARNASSQGGTGPQSQSRHYEEASPRMPEGLSYSQKRAWQDQVNAQRGGSGRG